MSYIVLNGKKSTDVQGLLIQTLPPISKPLLRTQVNEIDGRDGDIITPLGYSAYNKEFTIGLYGKYNVDDAIEYFDSKGTVVFSNEPDKFYFYEIIEQIDFERLLRFKTAKVVMHVQPFKYSAVDSLQSLIPVIKSEFKETKDGLTVEMHNNVVHVYGHGTGTFYIPIDLKNVKGTISIYSDTAKGYARVIQGIPDDEHSFGGDSFQIKNGKSSKSDSTERDYNYLWLWFSEEEEVDFTFYICFFGTKRNGTITNLGNVESRPKLIIYGETLNDSYSRISINGTEVLRVKVHGYVEIDTRIMEAVSQNGLANRQVSGDYTKAVLKVGSNTITWTNSGVAGVDVVNFSRWR